MTKINTDIIKTNVMYVYGDLRRLVSAYVTYANRMKEIRSMNQYSVEWIQKKDAEYIQELNRTALSLRVSMTDKLEKIREQVLENNKVFDFSDPELANCITLLQTSGAKIPYEVMNNIATRFMGNRQALLTLRELAPESYKNMFGEGIFDAENIIDELSDLVWRITEKPKENIFLSMTLKRELKKFACHSGVELADEEIDLGEDYYSLVTMQMRAAAGIGTAD